MLTGPDPTEFLSDPLTPVARKARRDLLLSSSVGAIMYLAGIVPTRISAFGVDLSVKEQKGFTTVAILVIAYFFVAFASYGSADFLIWRKRYHAYLEGVEKLAESWSQEDQQEYDEMRRRIGDISWVYSLSKPAAFIRIAVEFGLPLLFGMLTIGALLLRTLRV